jgi:hypothetical protein
MRKKKKLKLVKSKKTKVEVRQPQKAKPVSLTRAAIARTLGTELEKPREAKYGKYSLKMSSIICERMAKGETVTNICRDETMPTFQTVQNWRRLFPAFEIAYANAQLAQTECWVEEVKSIADDGKNDWMERESRNGNYTVLNSEHVTRSMLRINTIKWIAAIRNPKKYGPKAELTAGDSLKNVMDSFAQAVNTVNNNVNPSEHDLVNGEARH